MMFYGVKHVQHCEKTYISGSHTLHVLTHAFHVVLAMQHVFPWCAPVIDTSEA
jgi:nitrogen fixation protein FixH